MNLLNPASIGTTLSLSQSRVRMLRITRNPPGPLSEEVLIWLSKATNRHRNAWTKSALKTGDAISPSGFAPAPPSVRGRPGRASEPGSTLARLHFRDSSNEKTERVSARSFRRSYGPATFARPFRAVAEYVKSLRRTYLRTAIKMTTLST